MKKRDVLYHEKSKAWRIMRPIHMVHTTGGSWFYPWYFKTEKEALEMVKERQTTIEGRGKNE